MSSALDDFHSVLAWNLSYCNHFPPIRYRIFASQGLRYASLLFQEKRSVSSPLASEDEGRVLLDTHVFPSSKVMRSSALVCEHFRFGQYQSLHLIIAFDYCAMSILYLSQQERHDKDSPLLKDRRHRANSPSPTRWHLYMSELFLKGTIRNKNTSMQSIDPFTLKKPISIITYHFLWI